MHNKISQKLAVKYTTGKREQKISSNAPQKMVTQVNVNRGKNACKVTKANIECLFGTQNISRPTALNNYEMYPVNL